MHAMKCAEMTEILRYRRASFSEFNPSSLKHTAIARIAVTIVSSMTKTHESDNLRSIHLELKSPIEGANNTIGDDLDRSQL